MDSSPFDDLLRRLTNSRRSLVSGSVAALAGWLGVAAVDAKKKKKQPCKKKCYDGCCTKKYGKCIPFSQQTPGACGTGGQICGQCGGFSPSCADGGCTGCCTEDDQVCLSAGDQDAAHCGSDGDTCQPCAGSRRCQDQHCCAPLADFCDTSFDCCDDDASCPFGFCCKANGDSCDRAQDCCNSLDRCVDATCCRDVRAACDETTVCCDNIPCQGGVCCQPLLAECRVSLDECCAGLDCSSGRCCAQNGSACVVNTDCCEDEDICETDGVCKRKHREFCDDGIICEDAHPFCVAGQCLRCELPEVETGTSQVCCRPNYACPGANGDAGACCVHEHCCVPNPEGGGVCLELEYPAC